MTDELVEQVAVAICGSGKFETGQGTCALLCMDQLGSARSRPCHHAVRIHGDFARAIIPIVQAHDAARITELEAVCRNNVRGWENAVEMGLLPPQHHMSAKILADENRRALQGGTHDAG